MKLFNQYCGLLEMNSYNYSIGVKHIQYKQKQIVQPKQI